MLLQAETMTIYCNPLKQHLRMQRKIDIDSRRSPCPYQQDADAKFDELATFYPLPLVAILLISQWAVLAYLDQLMCYLPAENTAPRKDKESFHQVSFNKNF